MVPRRGSGCHAGEARAKAAIVTRIAAQAQSWATGQADAMAIGRFQQPLESRPVMVGVPNAEDERHLV